MRKTIIVFVLLCSVGYTYSQNTAYGTSAGNTSGARNSSFGESAGDVVTGNDNVFVGHYAGKLNTSGSSNTFMGSASGQSNLTGIDNVFLGYGTGYGNTSGQGNIFVGRSTGFANTTGNYNVYLGLTAGRFNSSGYQNVGVGRNASFYLTTGYSNVTVGDNSGYNTTTGNSNVFIGVNSGYSLQTGTGNIFIGSNAGYSETGSNKLYIDNSNTATPLIYGDFNSNQVGINALPTSTYALNVGGTINATGLYVNGSAFTGNQWAVSGSNISFNSGIVSVGTTATPTGYKLAVGGKMVAEEVVVKLQGNWPDYVFDPRYKLTSLSELEQFIIHNKHLPGVPTAVEVKENGVSVGEMNAILMKKVEELTLYIIDQQKEIEAIKMQLKK